MSYHLWTKRSACYYYQCYRYINCENYITQNVCVLPIYNTLLLHPTCLPIDRSIQLYSAVLLLPCLAISYDDVIIYNSIKAIKNYSQMLLTLYAVNSLHHIIMFAMSFTCDG